MITKILSHPLTFTLCALLAAMTGFFHLGAYLSGDEDSGLWWAGALLLAAGGCTYFAIRDWKRHD